MDKALDIAMLLSGVLLVVILSYNYGRVAAYNEPMLYGAGTPGVDVEVIGSDKFVVCHETYCSAGYIVGTEITYMDSTKYQWKDGQWTDSQN